MTLPELVTGYIDSRVTLSQVQADMLGYACRSISRYYGRAIEVSELTPQLVLPWLRHRAQQRALSTVKRERGDLLTLWRWAHAQGLIETLPSGIPSIKLPRRLPVYWRVAEMEAIIVSARSWRGEMRGTGIPRAQWWSSFILTAYCTGARLSALLAIRSAECSLAERRLTLSANAAKTGIEQLCNLTDQATAAIAAHYDPAREFLWPWPYARRQLFSDLGKILRRAGLPADRYRKFHSFRRTCATLTAQYASPEIAQQTLGHTSPQMTAAYIHPDARPRQTAADVLPALDI